MKDIVAALGYNQESRPAGVRSAGPGHVKYNREFPFAGGQDRYILFEAVRCELRWYHGSPRP